MKKINAKVKGANGEREAAKFLQDLGFKQTHRAQQFKGTADSADIEGAIEGIHFEIKRVEKLNIDNAVAQAERDSESNSSLTPVVMHRKNHKDWLLTIRAKDLFSFCEKVLNEKKKQEYLQAIENLRKEKDPMEK